MGYGGLNHWQKKRILAIALYYRENPKGNWAKLSIPGREAIESVADRYLENSSDESPMWRDLLEVIEY